MADNNYIDEQTFKDRIRDLRVANDKRYKFKADSDPEYVTDSVVLGFEPSTVEGAMWISIE